MGVGFRPGVRVVYVAARAGDVDAQAANVRYGRRGLEQHGSLHESLPGRQGRHRLGVSGASSPPPVAPAITADGELKVLAR